MKLTISNSLLKEYVQIANRLLSGPTQSIAADAIRFEVKGEQLILTSTDGDTRLTQTFTITEKEGENVVFGIKPSSLFDALKKIEDQYVSLTYDVNENTLVGTYRNGQGKFSVVASDVKNFPEAIADQEGGAFYMEDMTGKDFLDGLEFTSYAAGKENDGRPIMTGVHIDVTPMYVTFVATDGFLLSVYRNENLKQIAKVAPTEELQDKYSFTLPKKPTTLIKSLLAKKGEEKLRILVYKNFLEIRTSDQYLQCRLLDGKYPNYESVIPKDNHRVLTVDRELFLAALDRMSTFTDTGIGAVKLDLSENKVVLKVENISVNSKAEESVDANYGNDPITLSFKVSHLIDTLGVFKSKEIRMEIGDKARPMLIAPDGRPEGIVIQAAAMPLLF